MVHDSLGYAHLDARDRATVEQRVTARLASVSPLVGDYAEFPGGITRRISYIWPGSVQTSTGGSFYLGNYDMSFSGALFTGIPTAALTTAGGTRDACAWIFHHDLWGAGRGVDFGVPVRVWQSSVPAPEV